MRTLVAAFAVLVFSPWQTTQIETKMTPALVAEAIRLGESASERDNHGFYHLMQHSFAGTGPIFGSISTPFSRVVGAAYEAKRTYKVFAATDVTEEILASEMWVYGYSIPQYGSARIVNVDLIVILPHGSKDRSKAIRPIRSEPLSSQYKNLFGANLEGRGLLAIFPLELLSPAYDVHVVFDGIVSGFNSCSDCMLQLKADKSSTLR